MKTRTAVNLADLLAPARHILLDFDGPVCSLYGGQLSAAAAAERLRAVLTANRACDTEDIPRTDDAFDVLKLAHRIDATVARCVHNVLTEIECEAARTARPTPHAADFIRMAADSGRALAIVSNNSSRAIETYLATHGLVVDAIVGRTDADLTHLKPSPYLLHLAMAALATAPTASTLIGDSTTDIEAARHAPMASIGYANTPTKTDTLIDAGADYVVTDMNSLVAELARLRQRR